MVRHRTQSETAQSIRRRGGLKAAPMNRRAQEPKRVGPVHVIKAHHWGDDAEVELAVQVGCWAQGTVSVCVSTCA